MEIVEKYTSIFQLINNKKYFHFLHFYLNHPYSKLEYIIEELLL